MKNDYTDEKIFHEAVQQALEKMREKLKAQKAARKNLVLSRLKEEIARLRPQAERLLHGYPQKGE